MSRKVVLASLFLVLVACGDDPAPANAPDAAPPTYSTYPPMFIDLVGRSEWIFRATVTQLHAATEPPPPPFADPLGLWDLDKMIVVRIDRVSVEPQEGSLLLGSLDTIILAQPPEPEISVGTEVYFFVTWFQAGATWVFIEQGHWDAALARFEDLDAKVHEVQRYLVDRALYVRMVGAERVIRGTVLSTEDLPGDPYSDNLPDWFVGTVQPTETLRGPVEVAPLQVRYQGSLNACCYRMPRLEAGNDNVFLLYPDTVTGHPGPALIVVDPLDLQPAGELERLRRLLASPPRPPIF